MVHDQQVLDEKITSFMNISSKTRKKNDSHIVLLILLSSTQLSGELIVYFEHFQH